MNIELDLLIFHHFCFIHGLFFFFFLSELIISSMISIIDDGVGLISVFNDGLNWRYLTSNAIGAHNFYGDC